MYLFSNNITYFGLLNSTIPGACFAFHSRPIFASLILISVPHPNANHNWGKYASIVRHALQTRWFTIRVRCYVNMRIVTIADLKEKTSERNPTRYNDFFILLYSISGLHKLHATLYTRIVTNHTLHRHSRGSRRSLTSLIIIEQWF